MNDDTMKACGAETHEVQDCRRGAKSMEQHA